MRPESLLSHVRLITLAAVVTAATLAVVWGGVRFAVQRASPPSPTAELPQFLSSPGTAAPSASPLALTLPPADLDTDGDELPDALEALYRTDPSLPDTDGDGYLDGREVANGYDPTIPSPNDKLSTDASPSPGPGATFTERFFSQTNQQPSAGALTPENASLRRFIGEENARGYLPVIPDSFLRRTSATGKAAVARYLDAISIPQNPKLKAVSVDDIPPAFEALTRDGNTNPLDDIRAAVDANVGVLRETSVPDEAVELHRQYLAGTMALLDSIDRLREVRADYVGALVGASRIDELRGLFREITEGIRALEKKYTIT